MRLLVPFAGLAVLAAQPPEPSLPPPFATPSATHFPKVIGWPEGKAPTAPAGFSVSLYADGFDSPRWLYVLPNGDVLVSEARTLPKPDAKAKEKEGQIESKAVGGSADRITLLRDADGDGKPEVRETFLTGLKQPFGMAVVGEHLYVANTDAVVRFPYKAGQTKIEAAGTPVVTCRSAGTTTTGPGTCSPNQTGRSCTSRSGRRRTSARR